MAMVLGLRRIMATFESLSLKGRLKVEGRVVYAKNYAIFVHERLDLHHPIGQAKFLEQPARQHAKKMADIVASSVQNKNGLEEGVVRACNFLLARSRQLVPYKTGALYRSGRIEVR